MLITFIVRTTAHPEQGPVIYYTDIRDAFYLAYLINNDPNTIEFKCLNVDYLEETIPGSSYKPSKLVRAFDYSKEKASS